MVQLYKQRYVAWRKTHLQTIAFGRLLFPCIPTSKKSQRSCLSIAPSGTDAFIGKEVNYLDSKPSFFPHGGHKIALVHPTKPKTAHSTPFSFHHMITLSSLFTLEQICAVWTDPSPNTSSPVVCLNGLKYHAEKHHKLTVATHTELRPRIWMSVRTSVYSSCSVIENRSKIVSQLFNNMKCIYNTADTSEWIYVKLHWCQISVILYYRNKNMLL